MATAAFAHQGVQNPAVKARMDAMGVISKNTKVLGAMAKGETSFDAQTARDAARAIAATGAEVPGLFEAQETDPKSEALPAIWDRFDDFVMKTEDMVAAAGAASTSIETPASLRAALATIGGTCKACHEEYRE
ncbi:MAG: cytochrome c [Rhodobacter sp.]|nr:cytochrome c [Rhodobacter sp.]